MKKKNLDYLIDLGEVQHACNSLRERVNANRPDHAGANTIADLIIVPLEQYVEAEHRRSQGKTHTGIEAALAFCNEAHDLKCRLEDSRQPLFVEHINIIEKLWREFIIVVGSVAWMTERKVKGGGKDGGKKSGEVRREKAAPIHDAWQVEADKIWKKHPTWGKPQVAKRITEKIGGNPDTIRKTIKKPLP